MDRIPYRMTLDQTPSYGMMSADNPDLTLATVLKPATGEQQEGYDVSVQLLLAPIGSRLILADQYDAARAAEYQLIGTPVRGSTGLYVDMPVRFVQSVVGPPLPGANVNLFIGEPVATATEPPVIDTTGRPTVEEVALLIRARTKDSSGHEVGTFDDDTRPTGDDVEKQIDAAYALVASRFPPVSTLDPSYVPAFSSLVAYRAALRVEKSYFPEQVRTDRSAYDQLYQEYQDDLVALTEAIAAGGGEELSAASSDLGQVPVGSWTSIPHPVS